MKRLLLFLMLASCFISVCAQSHLRSESMQRAMSALREGDKENAIQYLLTELEENPTNGYAYAFVASILKAEDYKSPLLLYAGKAVQYLPAVENELMVDMAQHCGSIYDKGGDSVRAEQMYDRAVKANRKSLYAHLSRASFYDDHHDYQRLLSEGGECVLLSPSEPNGYYVISLAQLGLHNYPEALRQAQLAMARVDADNPGLLSSVLSVAARAECALHRYDQAVAHTTQSLRAKLTSQAILAAYALADSTDGRMLIDSLLVLQSELPTQTWVPGLMSDVYERNGDYVHATYCLYQMLDIEKSASLYCSIAENYIGALGDPEMGERMYRLAIEQDSTDARSYLLLGDLYHDLGRYEEALTCLNRSAELGGATDTQLYYLRGRVYRDQHDYLAAIADYRRQLLSAPSDADAAFTIGRTYLLLGDTAQADAYFAMGRDMMQDKPLRPNHLIAMGRCDEAMAAARDMVTRDKSAVQHYNKACIFSLAHNAEVAMAELERAFELGMRNFYHIAWDNDLDYLRPLPEFAALVQRYQTICWEEQKQLQELLHH